MGGIVDDIVSLKSVPFRSRFPLDLVGINDELRLLLPIVFLTLVRSMAA
jgi:hypothetical protein